MNLHFTGKDSSLATNEIQVFRTYHFASIYKKIPTKSVTKRLELLRIFGRESTKENLGKTAVKMKNKKEYRKGFRNNQNIYDATFK